MPMLSALAAALIATTPNAADRIVWRWGLDVVRRVQHTGAEETWTPTWISGASFLEQSGTLTGLPAARQCVVRAPARDADAFFVKMSCLSRL